MPLGFEALGSAGSACVMHRAPRAPVLHRRELGPAGNGTPERPFDFSRDPRFHHLFYGSPSRAEVADFSRWLRENRNAFVRLYHGTAAANPVLQQGLLPASQRRRNSHSAIG